jgi:hypothetical protein
MLTVNPAAKDTTGRRQCASHSLSGIRYPAALSSNRNRTVMIESLTPFISATDRRE